MGGSQREYITWLIQSCAFDGTKLSDVLTVEAIVELPLFRLLLLLYLYLDLDPTLRFGHSNYNRLQANIFCTQLYNPLLLAPVTEELDRC
jgi:hypothetical protein